MANYGAMSAFKKALQAPEDKFDFGTTFRVESGDPTVLVKLDDDLWVEISRSGIDEDGVTAHRLEMKDVIETIRDTEGQWEASHNWKDAKPGRKDDPTAKGKGGKGAVTEA